MLKRILLVTAFCAALLLLPLPNAEAGTYTVRQCHHPAPVNEYQEGVGTVFPASGGYRLAAGSGICANGANEYAAGIFADNDALNGQYGLIRFTAPKGTVFTGVDLDARLRSEAGHRARLSMANAAGVEAFRFAAGSGGPQGFAPHSWSALGTNGAFPQFVASLVCDNPGSSCAIGGTGGDAATEIRNLRLELRDSAAPVVTLDGSLLESGWLRQDQVLGFEAADMGSGIRLAPMLVNGELVLGSSPPACAVIPGTNDARLLRPCLESVTQSKTFDTTAAPFQDGQNTVVACGVDYGADANRTCITEKVQVDNTSPELAFRAQQLKEDPELIRAVVDDFASGLDASTASMRYRQVGTAAWKPLAVSLAGDELQARVDSLSQPAGEYEFEVSIEDVAGNRATSSSTLDGSEMTLRFPLKSQASLVAELGNGGEAQVVPFREPGHVRGQLRDPDGQPILNADITVTETFADGSLIDERVRTVTTDKKGRYESLLPPGPSRDVDVSYSGSRRYVADETGGLDFEVNGDAAFKTSARTVKAGNSVSFLGRVKHYYAQIPPGGKLVEVQAKSGNDWITLQEATGTDSNGRVELHHRFRRFYTQRVTFTFRLKVTSESDWPYRGAATSPRRKVTVIPR